MRLFFFEVTLTQATKAKLLRAWSKIVYQTHFTKIGRWIRRRLADRKAAAALREFHKSEWPPVHAPDSYGFSTTAKPKHGIEQDRNLINEVEKILRLPDKVWGDSRKITEK